MNTLAIASPHPRAAACAEHILFALTPGEQRLFLPRADLARFSAWPVSHVDPSKLTPEKWAECLRTRSPSVLVTAWSAKPLPVDWCRADDLPLRYVCHITGSVRNFVPRDLIARGVRVTNWGSVITHTVAEHALLMVLALLRNTPCWPRALATGQYTAELMPLLRTRSLRGLRVGLHGFGSVARELTGMLRPFQVRVGAWSEGVPAAAFHQFGVEPAPSLEALFENSDVLVECESLTPKNQGVVTAELLRRLPEDAVFVNVGRGKIADENALADLARQGRLRVGLDVFHREPLSPASPLHDIPGLLLSPHIAGPTWDTYHRCGDHALENLEHHLNGRLPDGLVSLETYDRIT